METCHTCIELDSLCMLTQCHTVMAYMNIQIHCLHLHLCHLRSHLSLDSIDAESILNKMPVWLKNRSHEDKRACSFLLTRSLASVRNNTQWWEVPWGHTDTNTRQAGLMMPPQRIFSSAALTGVIGHNCHMRLKGCSTIGTLCKDTVLFTSGSPTQLMLFSLLPRLTSLRWWFHWTALQYAQLMYL